MTKIRSSFSSLQDSHRHSLQTLELLEGYNDFMESITTMADFGSGQEGLDIEWWATRMSNDEIPVPLNIDCTAVDIMESCRMTARYKNVKYTNQDLEKEYTAAYKNFDLIWCHDVFQYFQYPLDALKHWRKVSAPGGMLVLIFPQNVNVEGSVKAYDQQDGQLYNWTMISLIHHLALAGWNCAEGFFSKRANSPWIHAAVYNTDQPARNVRETSWYDLAESGLLPESLAKSVNKYGYARERDLIVPWLDKSLSWMGQQ